MHEDYERVTVTVAVTKVKPVEILADGQKQEVIVADDTAKTTFVLWENTVDSLIKRKSYCMQRIQVHISVTTESPSAELHVACNQGSVKGCLEMISYYIITVVATTACMNH